MGVECAIDGQKIVPWLPYWLNCSLFVGNNKNLWDGKIWTS